MSTTALFANRLSYLETVVSPTAKFQFALLIVEREPRDVDFTGTFENSRGKVTAATVTPYDDVGLIGAIEFLIGTVQRFEKQQKAKINKMNNVKRDAKVKAVLSIVNIESTVTPNLITQTCVCFCKCTNRQRKPIFVSLFVDVPSDQPRRLHLVKELIQLGSQRGNVLSLSSSSFYARSTLSSVSLYNTILFFSLSFVLLSSLASLLDWISFGHPP